MSLRETLSEFSSAVKSKLGGALSDPDLHAAERELERSLAGESHEAGSPASSSTSARAMDEGTARTILGLTERATLDEVRVAAATLGRRALAGRLDDAERAIDRIVAAAEHLEERLLPLSGQTDKKPQTPTTPTPTRTRATARR
jgi:hypothetical protein